MAKPFQASRQIAFLLATAGIAAVALLVVGCVKVKPSPYQRALQAYYQELLSGTSETSLNRAIDGLNQRLRDNPADAGMLMLRASARLELIRIGLQGPDRRFSDEQAVALGRDLRLIQTLLDQPGSHPPWLAPRTYTVTGDLMLLRALAVPSAAGAENVHNNILRLELYQLAAQFYMHGASGASQAESAVRGNKDLEIAHLAAITKEKANATDGYVNAIGGMAQSEEFLGLRERTQSHLLEAGGLLTDPTSFPQVTKPTLTPKSLYSYPHALLAQLARASESNPLTSFADRMRFAELALREDIAAAMLSEPIRSISASSFPDVESVASYFSSLTLRVDSLEVAGQENVATEKVSFTLRPDLLYSTQDVQAEVPFLTLTVDNEGVVVRLPKQAASEQPSRFLLPPQGISVTIHSSSGNPVADSETRRQYFLGRKSSFLQRGRRLVIKGPADNVLGSILIP